MKIRINNLKRTIELEDDKSYNLMNALLENDIYIDNSCNGKLTCGKCKIKVVEGNVNEITDTEKRLLKKEEIENGIRLSCAVTMSGDVVVETLSENSSIDVLDSGDMPEFEKQYRDGYGICVDIGTTTVCMNLVDLKTGECRDHKAEDYITKETSVDPSDENMDIWLDALETFFVNDKELIEYVQKVAGISLIGKVYIEALIIAYGDGRNGKSTFWNTISRVLNLYSGSISADILTVNSKRNAKLELAETRGKRLLIAAELQEGLRLNTSNVKQLCSTDEIVAEKKYRDPFKFIPSHTLVLYTNHLPKVGALDEGTWRRLIVIPFEAKIEGSSDIKNYTDYLVDKAGGAVLKWLIEGAKKAIDEDFKFSLPKKVADAINEYKESNNWFKHFLNECCEMDSSFEEKSGEVYQEYRAYCLRIGDYVRSTTDFYSALSSNGFNRVKLRDGIKIQGLKLKSDFV